MAGPICEIFDFDPQRSADTIQADTQNLVTAVHAIDKERIGYQAYLLLFAAAERMARARAYQFVADGRVPFHEEEIVETLISSIEFWENIYLPIYKLEKLKK